MLKSYFRHRLMPSILNTLQLGNKPIRYAATGSKVDAIKNDAIVTSENGNVIICWHPESCIPYESTMEIPIESRQQTPLKHNLNAAKASFSMDHPYFEIKRLQGLTYTNKHIWFPRPERKMVKFKEKQPKDREYL